MMVTRCKCSSLLKTKNPATKRHSWRHSIVQHFRNVEQQPIICKLSLLRDSDVSIASYADVLGRSSRDIPTPGGSKRS